MDILCEMDGGRSIRIKVRDDQTPSTAALLASLPFEGQASRWGDEVYFGTPFHTELEADARCEMDVGEVAYWPDGDALALFFGKTPASTDDKPRAYTRCNIIGRIMDDPSHLGSVRPGEKIRVSRV